ncbi:MAG: aspartate aminotransferase family protein [Gammaproteobacteria bacterium]|nr:aspartate aminotransferase family protein [Gammaproteobacteria bacterium]
MRRQRPIQGAFAFMGSDQFLMQTYTRLPIGFDHGQGSWLWDTHGNKYLDAVSGIAVVLLGHAHPEFVAAISDQAGKLVHTSNLFQVPLQAELGERLCAVTGMERAFFGNSGAEANEAAIKLARRVGHVRGMETPSIIVTDGAFHGRTMATLTATGNRKVHAGFEPLVGGFKRIPYDDLEALANVGKHRDEVIAVLVEPIQGENGVVIPKPGYLRGLREICDALGWLLMLDEIQTGMGRTGKWFAFQHEDIQPDVITLAKSLGNGVPIGACLARGAAAEALVPGSHGSTFGGNPLACRAALTVLDCVDKDNLVAHAAELGAYIVAQLEHRIGALPIVAAVRGSGLMIGVELHRACSEIVNLAMEAGVLVNVTNERIIRLLPPLNLTQSEADILVDAVASSISEFAQSP